jgi:hypothetical protein
MLMEPMVAVIGADADDVDGFGRLVTVRGGSRTNSQPLATPT